MIRVSLPDFCADNEEALLQRLQFALSPLHEVLRSLHVLRNPRHHGIHLPWVAEVTDILTPEMWGDLDYFALCYELGIPSTLVSGLKHWDISFEKEIAALAHLDTTKLLEELERISRYQRNHFIPSLARGIEWKGMCFSDGHQLVSDLQHHPHAVVDRFINFIRTYWKDIFIHVWTKLHKQLLTDITFRSRELQHNGIESFLCTLSERLVWEKEYPALLVRKPFDWTYQMQPEDCIVLVPSYFVWPHLFIDIIENGITITYASSHASEESSLPQLTDQMTLICKALGEPNRLQILILLQDRGQTTQGLAQLCHLSEGTVSRHLQILKQANLVTSKQEGKYMLYRSSSDIVHHLSQLVISDGV